MPTVNRLLALIALVSLLQSATPLHGQTPLTCPAQGTMVIGHFDEGGAEVGEFCRYLIKHGIRPGFQNFGDIRNAGTAKGAADALEGGRVHIIWLGTSALARLVSDSNLRAKVLAISDFTVFQVISSTPNAVLVDSNFAPTGVAVKSGRSAMFADTLFIALDKPVPRCLGGPPLKCDILPREGDPEDVFSGGLIDFLNRGSSGAVILGSSPFAPSSIRDPVREVLALAKQSRLIGIPPATVLRIATVHGMFAEVSIPKGHYGTNIPNENIPTAADPRLLISGTPPEVAEQVRDFVKQVNKALLKDQPRVSPEHLKKSLELVRQLGESLGGRVVLHEEYVKQLQLAGPGPTIIIPIPIPLPRPGPRYCPPSTYRPPGC